MSENHSLNHFYPGKTTTYYAGLWRHPVMKILYYELKSILIQKIRKLLLDHIYSQTGELWNTHPITPPPSAKTSSRSINYPNQNSPG